MNNKNKNPRIVKYRKRRYANVGVIIFIGIFIYFLIYTAMFVTRDKISVYEVVYGKTAESSNKYYEALAVREETVNTAPNSGYLNCFVGEGSKVAVGGAVYTIDENGKVAGLLQESLSEQNALTEENYADIKNIISEFTLNYDDSHFDSVYNFKVNIDASLLEYVNMNKINEILNGMTDTNLSLFNMIRAPKSGIVSYVIDGYEDKNYNSLKLSDFDKSSYSSNSYKSNDLIAAGTPIYKTISNEEWHIIIPFTEEDVKKYFEDTLMKIRFKEDGLTAVGDFEIIYIEGQPFGKVTLNQYMVRYASERFINVEIVEKPIEGLKIPKTSLVDMDFYTIPERFATMGGNTKEVGFLLERYDDKGNMNVEYITPQIYQCIDGYYYVSTKEFEAGWNLTLEDNSEKYTVSAKASLTGVYNINNGYCVFREVHILADSTDYYIIESGTTYGLLVYDHIVLDSSTVDENQIVYH